MRFYRNLGPICFTGETNAFEIFSAQPSTHIFQPKCPSQSLTHYQKIATFYNNYLGQDNFQAYQQKDKNVSLYIKNSKKQQLCQIDCNRMCKWIEEATKIVLRITEVMPGFYGDFSAMQFFTVGTRKVFVYIPVYPKNPEDRQIKQIEGIVKMVNWMKAEKDRSQQLLQKKLAKCSCLQDIIQQLGYFCNIYGYGVNKKYQKIMKLQQNLIAKKVSKNDKSKRKTNLFEINLMKSQPKFYSYLENNYISSQPRKSSPAIHISIPEQKKSTVSLHAMSQRRTRPLSVRKPSKNIDSVISLKNSKINESIETKAIDKARLLKKMLNKSDFEESDVTRKDQQKLLKRLQNRKNEEKKICEIDFTKSVRISQNNRESLCELKKEAITNQSSNLISVDLPRIQFKSQTKQTKVNHQKTRIEEKVDVKQKRESLCPTIKQNIKQLSKNPQKHQSPRQSKSKNTIINQLNVVLNATKNLQKKQQPLPPTPLISSFTMNKTVVDEPEKKLKKKKILMNSGQIASDQLQVIELDVKNKPNKVQEVLLIKEQSFNQTRKNSFKSPKSTQLQKTKRVFKKQSTIQEKLNERLKNIDLMGVAVANTIGHLNNYQKIFWELPMFFIYRAFYFFRVQIIEKLQQLPYGTTPLIQIKQQNSMIFESVVKLIKIVNKKIKKNDPNLLASVKAYLTLQSRIDCTQPMKIFLNQYILSLQEAILSDYSELTMHLLQIVDAYLIYFGVSIDLSARTKAQSSKGQMKIYLQKQLKTIKTYF